jgi:glycosyltransferase involved in cell wall biosynthesis
MRSWFMAKYFDARHDVTLMAFSDVDTERTVRQAARQLHGECFGVTHGPLAGGRDLPRLVRGHYRENMRAALKLIPFEQFDVALVDSLYMAAYRDEMPAHAVLCEQNIESELVAEAAEREPVRAYEDRTWPDFPLRFVTSEVDLAIMNSRCRTGRAVVVPNGADPDQEIGDARPDLNTILLAGSLDYHPNIDGTEWFLAEVWPLIRKRNGAARLLIAGRNPPKEVRRFDGRDGAIVIPNPPSMVAVAARASVSIAPLRLGSGTRIKILDSFAWGIPVVSTPKGCEGLDAGDGEHLLIRSEPAEFAEACNRVLRDQALWAALRRNGRNLLTSRYSWNSIFATCEQELTEHLAGIGADQRRRWMRA